MASSVPSGGVEVEVVPLLGRGWGVVVEGGLDVCSGSKVRVGCFGGKEEKGRGSP